MIQAAPTHAKETTMNELFLALAEERRLKAQRADVPKPAGRPAALHERLRVLVPRSVWGGR